MNRKHPAPPNLGKRIRELRKQKQWSIVQLADASGISKSHVSQIERGEIGNPTIGVMSAIADGLGIRLAELVAVPQGSSLDDAFMKVVRSSPPATLLSQAGSVSTIADIVSEIGTLAEHAAETCRRIEQGLRGLSSGVSGE